MSLWAIAGLVLLAAVAARVVLAIARAHAHPVVAEAVIADPEDHTTIDPSGAVRSVQAANLTLPADRLEGIWTPMHLERLARTYWRFLSRCTLGLIRVAYTPRERFVVLLARPLVLLRFQAPEYEMDARRGVVRWRIEQGILVSRRGRGGVGHLTIDIQRSSPDREGRAVAYVEVEVANFYPAVASAFTRFVYANTQSRLHVIVTHGFLRSLARLDLAESRVGRLADATLPEAADSDLLPDPPPRGEPASDRPR